MVCETDRRGRLFEAVDIYAGRIIECVVVLRYSAIVLQMIPSCLVLSIASDVRRIREREIVLSLSLGNI